MLLFVSLLYLRSFACEVICRHALSAVLHPPPGGGRAAITVTTSLLLWVLEGDQESCAEVLAERWGALRLRVAALAGEVCVYIYIIHLSVVLDIWELFFCFMCKACVFYIDMPILFVVCKAFISLSFCNVLE